MKLRHVFTCCVCVLVLSLSACGKPHRSVRSQSNARDAVLVPGPDSGVSVAVVSMTVENLDFRRAALIAMPITRSTNGKDEMVAVLRISNGIPSPEPGRQSDFPDIQGKLFSTALLPGQYRLQPWVVYDKELYVTMKNTTSWGFTVKPGEAVYLGNYHFGLIDGFHFFTEAKVGGSNIERVRFELRDQFERDFQLLQARYAGIAAGSVRRADPRKLAWTSAEQTGGHNDGNWWLGYLPVGTLAPGPFAGIGNFSPAPSGGAFSLSSALILIALSLLEGFRRHHPLSAISRCFSSNPQKG